MRRAICFFAIHTAVSSHAADLTGLRGITVRSDIRTLRRLSTDMAQMKYFGLVTKEAEENPMQADVLLGLAYERAEDNSSQWNTPLDFTFRRKESNWQVKIASDGYARGQDSAGSTLSGWADIKINYLYALSSRDSHKLTAVAGLVAPTHGDYGSANWKQQVGLTYDYFPTTSPWEIAVTGIVRHLSGGVLEGASAYPLYLKGQLINNLTNTRSLNLALDRYLARGTSASFSSISFEYDFLVSNKLLGALSVSRVLTTGQHAKGIEFDIQRTF